MDSFADQITPIILLSMKVSGLSVLLGTLLGVPLGVFLGRMHFRWKWIIILLVHTGMALPPVLVGLVIYLLLSRSGPLGGLQWLFTPQAMILSQVILTLPVIIAITQNAMESQTEELFFQLRTLGASENQANMTLLREAWPGVMLAVATAFGRSLSEVGAVLLVGGNIQGQTRVLTTAIILETGKGEIALALTLGGILMLIALIVNCLIYRLQGRSSL